MKEKEEHNLGKGILLDLYNHGFIETIYNTNNEKYQQGWILKSGLWSPWYFNLRPLGASPKLAHDIASAMNQMIISKVPNLTQIVGIEMAGVPLASAIGTLNESHCNFIHYSYTRALPGGKPRTPEEAKSKLEKMKIDFGYGGKELVEGRFKDGDNICIVDDMVTNFGSKLIAKYIIEYEMERRGIKNVNLNHVAVVLDREQGADKEAKKQGMNLHSLIKFKTHGLSWLKDIMLPQEYKLISDYQENPQSFNDESTRKAIEEAKIFRGK